MQLAPLGSVDPDDDLIFRWQKAKRILCVRLDTIGDVVMTTPAIRAVRMSAPGRHITLLTSSSGSAVAELIPEIDHVISYSAPWMKASDRDTDIALDVDMIAQLRDSQFDAAIIFTVFSQNPLPAALLCYLANIPLRLGFCRENPYQLLTPWIRDFEPEHGIRHEVQRQLDLVAEVGCHTDSAELSLDVPADALDRMSARLRRLGIDLSAPWVVLHPGATAPSRRYPPEQFAEAATLIMNECRSSIVLTGDSHDLPLIETIQENVAESEEAIVSLAGQLTLAELSAVIELAPVLLTNNTGPAHLSAAVGTPVVDLYALTNPQHTPWMVPSRVLSHDVPCKYCYRSVCPYEHHACLRRISPREVAQAVHALLSLSARHHLVNDYVYTRH